MYFDAEVTNPPMTLGTNPPFCFLPPLDLLVLFFCIRLVFRFPPILGRTPSGGIASNKS